tara:strand:- start:62 stop:949 length:888 start_codon:yes stop_codon:yes gene_type:complete
MSGTILFARIAPSELNIITTENNNIIDLGLCCQIRDPDTGDDIWTGHGNKHVSRNNILSWKSFVESFYGGGEGHFGLSKVAGRMLTMIGVSGEYANGVPQAGSALTHLTDRARTDFTAASGTVGPTVSVSGVSILNDVTDSIVYDLGLPHDAWDSCSYMNVVNELQDIHTVADACSISGSLNKSCSLSIEGLVHEIAASYDRNIGVKANFNKSAVYNLYSNGLEQAIVLSLAGVSGLTRQVLAFSILFKNSTPGVRNVEFRIHFLVDNLNTRKTLESLCAYSAEAEHFKLDGTQS